MSQGLRPTSLIVAEIFTDLGIAFTRLGELEMLLNPENGTKCKISETDLLAIRQAVTKFGEGIDKICQRIKDRTLLQIRSSMKRHAYEEAGIPLRKQQIISKPSISQQEKGRNASSVLSQSSAKSADITLNMLNATEQEVDVEGLSAADKLEYDDS